MAMMRPLAIVGPTASGKSALAMALAERTERVELLSIDSMQVYRGMDIGTAKPSTEEQRRVPHHLLDLLDPDEEASVSWFQVEATRVRDDLQERGATPIYVGGTGLYHRAVVDDLDIPGQWPDVAAELQAEPDTAGLHSRLVELDPVAAARMEPENRRRVVRALEVTIGGGRRFSEYGPGLDRYPPSDVVQIGLRVERAVTATRVEERFDHQLRAGFVDEVSRLDQREEGWSRTASQALGYRELLEHVRDGRSLDECRDLAISRIRRFATRQERWFRRDPRVTWVDADRPDLVDVVLARWSA
jgi:tRNA dimethylallyltransferase